MVRRMQNCGRTGGVLVALALLGAPARAQDGDAYSSVGEGSSLEEAVNPQGLPGRENAPRERPQPPEEAVEAEAVDREWFGGRDWWAWDRATGDWGGVRTRLEEVGLTLGASYTWEWSSVYRGGVRRGASTRSLFDVNLTLDLDVMAGLEGGSVYADYYSTDDGHPGGSLDAGDFQGFSNIQTDENLDQLAEVWYQQVLFDGLLRLKAGKIDAGGEFGFPESGGEFLNCSAAYVQTNPALPTYPDPAVGVLAFVYPTERTYVGGGVFDGAMGADGVHTGGNGPATFFGDDASDDWYLIGEGGWRWEGSGPVGTGRLAAGAWWHTGEFQTFDGGTAEGTGGAYAIVEQRLWSPEPEDEESTRGLTVFMQFGWADGEVSDAAGHYAAGLALDGPLASRPGDATGVYISTVDLSGDAGYAENETAIEVFYKLQLTPFFSIKPDLQYIVNPGGDATLDNALVGALRAQIDF